MPLLPQEQAAQVLKVKCPRAAVCLVWRGKAQPATPTCLLSKRFSQSKLACCCGEPSFFAQGAAGALSLGAYLGSWLLSEAGSDCNLSLASHRSLKGKGLGRL